MDRVRGYHGEWNMGSPGGWDYQRIAQALGKMAWQLVEDTIEVGVQLDFDHPQINAVPGFAKMLLKAHWKRHGRNQVHAVLLAEPGTLDVVLENRNFVDYLNGMEGVTASLADPSHLSLKGERVLCRGREATVIFMDFNVDTLLKMGEEQDIKPIIAAIRNGLIVNPRGMEPLGSKGVFEAITETFREELSPHTVNHTPWTRQFFHRKTTGPKGEPIADLVEWTERNWKNLILKPAHGYSGHGIFVGFKDPEPYEPIARALDSGDYIVQELVPLGLWSEVSVWPNPAKRSLELKEWQTDFRCFITDEGLQGFLARFGGVPTNVGSGGGIQPLAVLRGDTEPRAAVEKINAGLLELGYEAYLGIQARIEEEALKRGFTYLLGPIMVSLRPRLLTRDHMGDLKTYSESLWKDAIFLELLWRKGKLDQVVKISPEARRLAMEQPWRGSPALMVSDGLFSFGADLLDEAER